MKIKGDRQKKIKCREREINKKSFEKPERNLERGRLFDLAATP